MAKRIWTVVFRDPGGIGFQDFMVEAPTIETAVAKGRIQLKKLKFPTGWVAESAKLVGTLNE